jgi:Cytokinin dehydrogenase 1, FAD and cytokinin binding
MEVYSPVIGGSPASTVRLLPTPDRARGYQLFYPDLDTYLADQQRLLQDGRFSSLEGQAARPVDDSGWEFFVDAAAYYDAAQPPDDAALLAGLGFDPGRTIVTEYDYLDWVNRLAPAVEFLKQIGAWTLPHPWLNLFLPASRTGDLVAGVRRRQGPLRPAARPHPRPGHLPLTGRCPRPYPVPRCRYQSSPARVKPSSMSPVRSSALRSVVGHQRISAASSGSLGLRSRVPAWAWTTWERWSANPGVVDSEQSRRAERTRQPVSSCTSRTAAASGSSPGSTRPAGSSHPHRPVMNRCRQISSTSPAALVTTAPAPWFGTRTTWCS